MVGVTTWATAGEYETAQSLLTAQRWTEALPILKKLENEEPESITLALDLSQVLLRLNRREEALELLRKRKLLRQADIAARSFLSKESFHSYQQGLDWLSKRAYPQACERFERALEKDQAHLDILFRLSQCEVLDGNADLAVKNLDQLERIHAKTPESQLWRARAAALRGRVEEATSIYSSLSVPGKTTDPTTELVALWWGEALLAAGLKSAALGVLETDVRRNPNHLQTALAVFRIRMSQTESPNQIFALDREFRGWENLLVARAKEKKKRPTPGFALDLFDLDAVQRTAADTRRQLNLLTASASPRPTPSNL